jgi:hypothetical protein
VEPGIPGGVPALTTVCATVNASTYGNGLLDASPMRVWSAKLARMAASMDQSRYLVEFARKFTRLLTDGKTAFPFHKDCLAPVLSTVRRLFDRDPARLRQIAVQNESAADMDA